MRPERAAGQSGEGVGVMRDTRSGYADGDRVEWTVGHHTSRGTVIGGTMPNGATVVHCDGEYTPDVCALRHLRPVPTVSLDKVIRVVLTYDAHGDRIGHRVTSSATALRIAERAFAADGHAHITHTTYLR